MAKEIYRVNPERYQVQYFDDQGGWVDDRAFPDPELAISWAEGSAPKYLVTYRVMDMEADE